MTILDNLVQLKGEAAQVKQDLDDALAVLRRVQAQIDQMYAALDPKEDKHWLLYPLDIPWKVSGEFGVMYTINGLTWQHEGIDLACPPGCGVRACSSGVVKFAGPNPKKPGYGNYVELEHSHNDATWKTLYAHLSDDIDCIVGQAVIAKQFLGRSGQTGNVSGAHLHLTVWSPDSTFRPAGCTEFLRGVVNPREWVQMPEMSWYAGR